MSVTAVLLPLFVHVLLVFVLLVLARHAAHSAGALAGGEAGRHRARPESAGRMRR